MEYRLDLIEEEVLNYYYKERLTQESIARRLSPVSFILPLNLPFSMPSESAAARLVCIYSGLYIKPIFA